MAELGTFSVLLAVAAAAWAVGAAALGTRRETFQRSAEGALRGAFLSLTVASAVLVALFLTRDFSVRYVAEYSDLALPTAYTVAAFWAGQDGSLLLWAWLLAGLAVLAVRRHRGPRRGAHADGRGDARRGPAGHHRAGRVHEQPLRAARLRPGGRRRPERDAAELGAALPPAGDLRRLRRVHGPVRVRGRCARDRPPRRPLDPHRAGVDGRVLAAADLRDPARSEVGLHRARLGRLLGLGPGREREPAAVVDRHRLPALGRDPGATRQAQGVERLARDRHVRAHDLRHVPGALRGRLVGPRLRRVERRHVPARRGRRGRDRERRARHLAAAAAAQPPRPDRAGVARGRVRPHQRAARRVHPGRVLGDPLPGGDVGPPWHRRHGRCAVLRPDVAPVRAAAARGVGAVPRARVAARVGTWPGAAGGGALRRRDGGRGGSRPCSTAGRTS
jgi:hypothetical protein